MANKPIYTVGRVQRDGTDHITGIAITDLEVPAADQEKACDIVADRVLDAGSPKQELGAFLASSLKTYEYEPEQTVHMNKTPRHGQNRVSRRKSQPAE